jgi:hypothetical protein
MKRLFALLLCGLAVLSLRAGEPKEFSPKDSGLKVKIPGEPKFKEQETNGTKIKIWFVERNEGKEAFLVMVSEAPGAEREDNDDLQKRLDGARDAMLRLDGHKLMKEAKITIDKKYPGRELLISVKDDMRVLNRYYLVAGRMYQVMAVGNKEFLDSEDVKKYLASFELTK